MTSAVPAALDALYALATTAMPDGVAVVDGAPDTVARPQYLAVGYGGDEGAEAVTETQDVSDAAMRSDLERFDVACEIAVWTGDRPESQGVNRRRAYELLELFTTAVAADPKLAGAVARARRSGHSYAVATTSKGPVALVRFTVRVEAFT